MRVFQKDPAVRVGAICDVYEPNLETGSLEGDQGGRQSPQGLPQLQGSCSPTRTSMRC